MLFGVLVAIAIAWAALVAFGALSDLGAVGRMLDDGQYGLLSAVVLVGLGAIITWPALRRTLINEPTTPIDAYVWTEPVADGLAPYRLSVAPPDEDLPITTVSASASLSGNLVARMDVTIGRIYVEFSQRRKWKPWKWDVIAIGDPPDTASEIRRVGVRHDAGTVLALGRRCLFSGINLRPLSEPRHPGRYRALLIVECLHPKRRVKVDFGDATGDAMIAMEWDD